MANTNILAIKIKNKRKRKGLEKPKMDVSASIADFRSTFPLVSCSELRTTRPHSLENWIQDRKSLRNPEKGSRLEIRLLKRIWCVFEVRDRDPYL